MAKHLGVYDEWEDLAHGYDEMRAEDHEDWCHWDCPGHRSCGCRVDKDFTALVSRPLGAPYDSTGIRANLRTLLLRAALDA